MEKSERSHEVKSTFGLRVLFKLIGLKKIPEKNGKYQLENFPAVKEEINAEAEKQGIRLELKLE